jgi:hypothetical protein
MKIKELLNKITQLKNGNIEVTLVPHSLIASPVVFNIECNNKEWRILDIKYEAIPYILDFKVLTYEFKKTHKGNFLLIEYKRN